jgi:hypothetical protein
VVKAVDKPGSNWARSHPPCYGLLNLYELPARTRFRGLGRRVCGGVKFPPYPPTLSANSHPYPPGLTFWWVEPVGVPGLGLATQEHLAGNVYRLHVPTCFQPAECRQGSGCKLSPTTASTHVLCLVTVNMLLSKSIPNVESPPTLVWFSPLQTMHFLVGISTLRARWGFPHHSLQSSMGRAVGRLVWA